MLPPAQRLRRSGDFGVAVRSGRRAARGVVVVHLLAAENSAHPTGDPAPTSREARPSPTCAGFVVSRAVGGAVARNRVRRRLRHLVRDRLDRLPAGSLLVVRALPGAADRPYSLLGADLDAALAGARGRRPRPRRQA